MRPLDVVFIGFGQMGKYANAALQRITEEFRRRHVDLRLFGVVEADEKIIEKLPDFVVTSKSALIDPGDERCSVHNILQKNFSLSRADRFIVYDASPTHVHYKNLFAITQTFPNAVYLGEKPLVTDRAQLKVVDQIASDIYCDFIETENLATLHLRNLVSKGLLEIRKLRFWRLNSIGLTKLFNPDVRQGVTGGALLDKCCHDVAITVALLQSAPNHGRLSYVVESAVPYSFMPYSLNLQDEGCFSTASNKPTKNVASGLDQERGENIWVADAAGHAELRWKVGDKEVLAEYNYGWLGVEQFDDVAHSAGHGSIYEQLGGFAIDEGMWRSTHEERADLLHRYEAQDARILLVEGRLRQKPVTLVVNFLSRDGIGPFILEIDGVHEPKYVPLGNPPHGDNSLARVFTLTLEAALGTRNSKSNFLHREVVSLVHEVIFGIRHQMFADAFDPNEEWEKALRAIGPQVFPVYPVVERKKKSAAAAR